MMQWKPTRWRVGLAAVTLAAAAEAGGPEGPPLTLNLRPPACPQEGEVMVLTSAGRRLLAQLVSPSDSQLRLHFRPPSQLEETFQALAPCWVSEPLWPAGGGEGTARTFPMVRWPRRLMGQEGALGALRLRLQPVEEGQRPAGLVAALPVGRRKTRRWRSFGAKPPEQPRLTSAVRFPSHGCPWGAGG